MCVSEMCAVIIANELMIEKCIENTLGTQIHTTNE